MFNLADYEPVEVRLEKFIKDYPAFRISTELEVVEATRYIVKAYLFKDAKDSVCLLYTSPSPRDYAASRMPSSA